MAALSIKDNINQQAYNKIMKGYDEGKAAGLTIAKNENQSDRVTPAQLKLIQEKQGVQSPYQPKEAVDPLDPSKGVVDKASIDGINTIMLPFNLKDRETDDHYGTPSGTPEEVDELLRRGWAHGPWEDDSTNWSDKTGAVQKPDGSWIYPTKDGKYIPETDEQEIERMDYEQHREMYDRNQPHPDMANVWSHETPSDTFLRKNYDRNDPNRLQIIREHHKKWQKEQGLQTAGYGPDQDTINQYRKLWIKHHNPNDPYKIPSDNLRNVQDIVIFGRWPQG